MKKVLIIGHPLAAPENRQPFKSNPSLGYFLCMPFKWHSRGLKTTYYTANTDSANCFSLPVIFSGHNSFFLWKGASDIFRQIKPDIVYCWDEPWCLSTFQILCICLKHHTPLYFYSAENRRKILPLPFKLFRQFVYKKACGAIAVTREVHCQLIQSGFKKNISEIPLWINTFPFIGPNNAAKSICFIGRLIALKRVHLIIECLNYIPDFNLKIIGNGPLYNELQKFSCRFNLQSRVRFTGRIDNTLLFEYLKEISLVIIPTAETEKQAEQFGKAALEAISMGLPVLTSSTGNYIQLAHMIPTLYAKDFTTPNDLAVVIKYIHDHYPTMEKLNESREIVQRYFSINAVSRQFNALFLNEQ